MSVSWNGPSLITPASGSAHTVNYELDVNQNDAYTGYTSRTYEHPANQNNTTAGITFYYNATTTKQYINVNIVGNTTAPDYVVNTTSNTGGSGISEVEYTTGDVIQTWSASYSGAPLCIFTTTSAMNFVVTSGPTVTSITVANANSATRSFTVAHTGTLTSSNIKYHIDAVDITSLGSPNTPITNLQTTTNGSTFDSFVLARNGTHTIEIGSQTLQFFVTGTNTFSTSLSDITVVFPTTVSAWHASYGPPYFTTCDIDTNSVTFRYNDTSGQYTKRNTLFLSKRYRSTNNTSQRGYFYQHSIYETVTANFTALAEGYIDPVALQSNTGSPNTTFSLSGNLIPGNLLTYIWNFATYTAPNSNNQVNDAQATTTSDGGGKRRRYPIISTNLFDRRRSIFSIGLTHKDETLF